MPRDADHHPPTQSDHPPTQLDHPPTQPDRPPSPPYPPPPRPRNLEPDIDPDNDGLGEEDVNVDQLGDHDPLNDLTPGEQPDDGDPGEEVEDFRAASTTAHFQIGLDFISTVKGATLENTGLPPDIVHRLRNPNLDPFTLDNPDQRLSLELFLATQNALQNVYANVRSAVQHRYPDASAHSLAQVKACLPVYTGVTSIANNMCINSCLAYTGPFMIQCALPPTT